MLDLNEIPFCKQRVRSADYKTHGEMCKAALCEQLGIDILIADFPGYVAAGKHVGLLVMPNPREPYYHDSWKTDGSEVRALGDEIATLFKPKMKERQREHGGTALGKK